MIGFGIYQCKEEDTAIFITEQSMKEVWTAKQQAAIYKGSLLTPLKHSSLTIYTTCFNIKNPYTLPTQYI
jgi:hypothetical protein